MNYRRFEQLIIGLGAITLVGSLVVSLQYGGPSAVEIASQVLLLGVLVAAVHWGRRGGMIATLVASLLYIGLQIPAMAATDGLTTQQLLVTVVRLAGFGLVGIVGGEACSRIKYVFARFDDSSTIDEWSRVYNQRHASRSIEQARARYTRYGEPFCLIVISLASALTDELSPARQRTLVRHVAGHLRNDVRMVDEVSRLDDGRFCILLPHTPIEGGRVVDQRVTAGVRRALGARPESVTSQCLGAADDTVALTALSESLQFFDPLEPVAVPES